MELISRNTKLTENELNKQKRVIFAQLSMEREQFHAEKARMIDKTRRMLSGGKIK